MSLMFFLLTFIIIISKSLVKGDNNETGEGLKGKHRSDEPDISRSHDHYNEFGHHDKSFDHESVTGSHHESEEFKDLEPEEAKRRLILLVGKIDKNNDSKITRIELFNWIMQSFRNLDIEDSSSKLQDVDENNDKLVSWNEYLTKTYNHNEKEIIEMLNSKNIDMKSFFDGIMMDKKKFQIADKNNDSLLNIEEFTKFSHPHNYPEMASFELAKTLEDFDKNSDGKVDILEFIGDDKLDNYTEEHERRAFSDFDKDKNGFLEGLEITDWIMPGFEKTAWNEVEHLFNETDINKDKMLIKEEIINQHELWVGSHATDYGKHLDDIKYHDEL